VQHGGETELRDRDAAGDGGDDPVGDHCGLGGVLGEQQLARPDQDDPDVRPAGQAFL
jgi:hypothetical protein